MILQPLTSQLSTSHRHHPNYVSLSSTHHYSLSLLSLHHNSTLLQTSHKFTLIKCSVSNVHSNEKVDYDKRPTAKWKDVYKRLSSIDDLEKSSVSVLNQCENEGIKLSQLEIVRVAKQLRKFKRYKLALQVYEWMSNKGERFTLSTSDAAVQLDLLAKVHGISSAEDYFNNLPDSFKDKRIYSSLLNALAHAKMIEKAENVINQMRTKGYVGEALPFNVMMTLYMKVKDHDKVETIILEMRERQVLLDRYSYSIWLTSSGSQGSIEKMEQVFKQMKLDRNINPDWTTFCSMATIYIRMGQIKKAEECLKKVEGRIMGIDRSPYHYLIGLYGMAGNKEEVYRMWNIYKHIFPYIPNFGYYTVISALVRLDDIQGAEIMYEEWLSVKSLYEPRIANLLMHWYSRNGFFHKAEALLEEVVEMGGNPTSITYEILAEGKIREGRICEALECLNDAVLARRSKLWKPKAKNFSAIFKMCEQEDDVASKEVLLGLMRRAVCFDDVAYMSLIRLCNGTVNGENGERIDDDDGDEMILNELEGIL